MELAASMWKTATHALCLMALLCIWLSRLIAHQRPNLNDPGVSITFVSALADFPSSHELESCSKAFSKHLALRMWAEEFQNVLILGDNDKVCDSLQELKLSNVKCIVHECAHVEEAKPILPCLLRMAESQTITDTIAFGNSDLIYRGMRKAVRIAKTYFDGFLIVGKRLDIEFSDLCKSISSVRSPKYAPSYLEIFKNNGTYHNEYGIDYFLFTKGALPLQDMPNFVIGAWKWDTWLLDTIIRKDVVPVIDGTDAIDAIHLQTTRAIHEERQGSDHNRILFERFYQINTSIPMWVRPSPYGHLLNDPYPSGYGTIAFAPYKILKWKVCIQWCFLNLRHSSCKDPTPLL